MKRPVIQRPNEILLNFIKAVVQKKWQGQGFKSLNRGLISNDVGQVIENDRTRILWSLLKKGCSMIGMLQN